ncbi:MAG: J domain-containing protein, partial [Cyanobacteria bacterium]|nr:J domain-containing protein [Cyanobacteriota bacterium]
MQIDYDALYIELTLKPGASPEQIQAAWKELSRLIHPDIKDPGPIQETATRRMSLVNDARDKLLAYWQQHNAPPPSRFQQQVAVSTPAPEGPKEKTWQEEAYEDWRKEYTDKKTQERNTANSYQQHHHGPPDEPPAAQRTPTPGFSPPAFSKLPHHHIYDFLNRQDKESMAPLVLGLASFMVPMFIVLMILGT